MTALTQASAKTPAATRPEIELMLCCARTRIDSATGDRIKTLLQQDIDWVYLIQTAGSHGLMPLLYWSLNGIGSEAVPKSIWSQLRNYFHTNAQHNLFLTAELFKILNLFEQHEIPVIPFKGPVLAVYAYGNLALRQFSDLDILVNKQHFLRAQELLISEGYGLWLQLSWQSSFVSQDNRVNVDLHYEFAPKRLLDGFECAKLWERLVSVSLTGKAIPNLSAEDLLLFLCVQLTRDFWEGRERLAILCDIAELVRLHHDIDWKFVLKQANLLGIERILFLGLFLAKDILGIVLPDEVWQRIQAEISVKSLAAQVRKRLLEHPQKSSKLLLENHLFCLTIRERFYDRLSYFFYNLLFYFIRPIPMLGQYGVKLFRRLSLF
jgi:Uncharacterised nucleotidyltransferase